MCGPYLRAVQRSQTLDANTAAQAYYITLRDVLLGRSSRRVKLASTCASVASACSRRSSCALSSTCAVLRTCTFAEALSKRRGGRRSHAPRVIRLQCAQAHLISATDGRRAREGVLRRALSGRPDHSGHGRCVSCYEW